MHNTLLDKLYSIVTTDEISNLGIKTASYILNMLFTKIHPDNGNVFVFDSFQTCKDYVHHMFSHMNGFTTNSNDLKYTLSIDNDDERYLNSLDEIDASSLDNICLLTVICNEKISCQVKKRMLINLNWMQSNIKAKEKF